MPKRRKNSLLLCKVYLNDMNGPMLSKLSVPATLVNVTVLTPYLDTGVTWSSVEERRITTITGPLSSMRTPDHPPCTQIADPIPETQTSR